MDTCDLIILCCVQECGESYPSPFLPCSSGRSTVLTCCSLWGEGSPFSVGDLQIPTGDAVLHHRSLDTRNSRPGYTTPVPGGIGFLSLFGPVPQHWVAVLRASSSSWSNLYFLTWAENWPAPFVSFHHASGAFLHTHTPGVRVQVWLADHTIYQYIVLGRNTARSLDYSRRLSPPF